MYTYVLTYNKFITSIYDYMYILFWGDYNLQLKSTRKMISCIKILGEADIFSPLYGVGEVDKH